MAAIAMLNGLLSLGWGVGWFLGDINGAALAALCLLQAALNAGIYWENR